MLLVLDCVHFLHNIIADFEVYVISMLERFCETLPFHKMHQFNSCISFSLEKYYLNLFFRLIVNTKYTVREKIQDSRFSLIMYVQ